MRSYFERDPAFEEDAGAAEVLKNDRNEDIAYFHLQVDIAQIYRRDRKPLFTPSFGMTRV